MQNNSNASPPYDDFWTIALDHNNDKHCLNEEEHENFQECTSSARTYNLPYFDEEIVSVHLSPLPAQNGVWSCLGGHAWYSSALLASLLLHNPMDQQIHCVQSKDNCSLTVLELGSGAVGLSSLATALLMSHSASFKHQRKLILTDNDYNVLNHLQLNMVSSLKNIELKHSSIKLPQTHVVELNWNNCDTFLNENGHLLEQGLDLVIGSELVYTLETGKACSKCVLTLLQRFKSLLVVIVQVTDRDGWQNVFLTELKQTAGIVVKEKQVPPEIDESARKLVPFGGSLDRFDFGICYISNNIW